MVVAAAAENSCTFEAGDHITLSCNAAGIPYDHHAIVLSVGSHTVEEDEQQQEGE